MKISTDLTKSTRNFKILTLEEIARKAQIDMDREYAERAKRQEESDRVGFEIYKEYWVG